MNQNTYSARNWTYSALPPRPMRPDGSTAWVGPAAFLIWFAIMISALLLSKRPLYVDGVVFELPDQRQRLIQGFASIFLLFGGLITIPRMNRLFPDFAVSRFSLFVFAACLLWLGACAALRQSLVEMYYIALFFSAIIIATLISTGPRSSLNVICNILSFMCAIIPIIAFIAFGGIQQRWVGGIHPNLIGFPIIVAGIGGLVYGKRIGYIIYLVFFAFALAISSRYSILCLILAALSVIYIRSRKRFGSQFILAAAILSAPVIYLYVIPILSRVFLLGDKNRGISSGAAGRADLNMRFFDQIGYHPLDGFGFRNRSSYLMTHNGYMNFTLEVGYVVSFLFIVLAIIGLVRLGRRFARNGDRYKVDVFLFLVLMSCLISALFQPQLVSFGDAQGAMLLLALPFALFSVDLGQATEPLRRSRFS